jgi:GGDEF domain-containing protein
MRAGLRRLGYRSGRWLILAVGVGILLIVAAVVYARRVETVEVVATLLFIPVFVALVLWGWRGGLAAGILAAAAYAWLRAPAIEAVGVDRFLGPLVSRGLAFIAFGTIGGWAARQVQDSLLKLDLYDQIDDATGLFNARFFLQSTDLEMSRAKRYETLFSVSSVDVPVAALSGLPGRKARRALRELARHVRASIRNVDRAIHADDGIYHRFTVILPETGGEGARVFTGRLAERVAAHFTERGVPLTPDRLQVSTLTHPDDEEGLTRLRDEFSAIDRSEHPEPAPAA